VKHESIQRIINRFCIHHNPRTVQWKLVIYTSIYFLHSSCKKRKLCRRNIIASFDALNHKIKDQNQRVNTVRSLDTNRWTNPILENSRRITSRKDFDLGQILQKNLSHRLLSKLGVIQETKLWERYKYFHQMGRWRWRY